jgi:lipoprotein NlpD
MVRRFTHKLIAAIMVAIMVLPALLAQNMEHTVAKGETLSSIARNSGLSLQDILVANHLTMKSTIKPGQKIILPVKTVAQASPVPSSKPDVAETVVLIKYTVVKGDTLYGIARQNGVEFSNLLKVNKLTEKSALKTGQTLVIPRPAPVPSVAPSENPGPSLATVPSPSPVASSPPAAAASISLAENPAQASEGTWLSTKPYSLGAKLSWPHPGERLLVDGKLPGLLIKAAKGDEVKSISSGKVIYSNPHSTFGYVVMVLGDNGFTYLYGGNDSSSLRMGDSVKIGDSIGQVGETPGFSDPQVYFSTWKDGAYIDPATVPRD